MPKVNVTLIITILATVAIAEVFGVMDMVRSLFSGLKK